MTKNLPTLKFKTNCTRKKNPNKRVFQDIGGLSLKGKDLKKKKDFSLKIEKV